MPDDVDLAFIDFFVQLVIDLLNVQISINHLLCIQLKTHNPRTNGVCINVIETDILIIEINKLLISFDDGLLRVWVVVDA